MEALGGFIVLFGCVSFFLGVVSLFRPIEALKIANRKTATFVLLSSVVSCGVGGSLMPPPKEEPAKITNTQVMAAKGTQPSSPDKPDVDPQATAKKDILALWSSVKSASADCDQANSKVADALGALGRSTTIYVAYENADRAHRICGQTWSELSNLEVPGTVQGDVATELEEALKNCRDAYLLRQMSLDKMKTVLNGDMRPSALQDYKQDAEAAQSGVLVCVAGMMGTGFKAGIDLKAFE